MDFGVFLNFTSYKREELYLQKFNNHKELKLLA